MAAPPAGGWASDEAVEYALDRRLGSCRRRTYETGSRCSSARVSSCASRPRSIPISRSRRSSTAPSRPAGRRCCSRARRAPSTRSSSTSSAPSGGCASRSASTPRRRRREARRRARDAAARGPASRKCSGLRSSSPSPTRGRRPCAAAACQEIVLTGDDVDLDAAPDPALLARRRRAVHHAAGRDHARPADRRRNVGMYRMQHRPAHDRACTGRSTRTAATDYAGHATAGSRSRSRSGPTRSPRTPPARRCPKHIDEFMFAGFLRGERSSSSRAKTVDLEVPAHAEIVLEGYVEPGDVRHEGPFGDHTGYYTAAEPFPVFHVTAMTMRRDAIYPSIVVGKPPAGGRLARQGDRADLPAGDPDDACRRSSTTTCRSPARSTTARSSRSTRPSPATRRRSCTRSGASGCSA